MEWSGVCHACKKSVTNPQTHPQTNPQTNKVKSRAAFAAKKCQKVNPHLTHMVGLRDFLKISESGT